MVSIKIGNKKIETNVFLSPLAGCADLAFRLIAREFGAGFGFFEMLDANALIYGASKNIEILKSHPDDQPIAAQLLGSGTDKMVEAARKLLEIVQPTFIDINAACPAKKVLKKKAGAYLLSRPEDLYRIISSLTQAISLPITVKLRTGFDERNVARVVEIAKKCQQSGAAALFVHGRTQKQAYTGEIDYEAIKAIKYNVTIPVFGSGNVFSPKKAKEMVDRTGCDGVLVARGSFGDPWIFKNIEQYLATGTVADQVSLELKIAVLKKHLAYVQKYKQRRPRGNIGFMRKIAMWYLKKDEVRRRVTEVKSYEELLELIDSVMGNV